MEGYSARQINDTTQALRLLKIMWHASKQDFIKMIGGDTMKNCDVTEDDVKRMYNVWIVDVEAIKGKIPRNLPTG